MDRLFRLVCAGAADGGGAADEDLVAAAAAVIDPTDRHAGTGGACPHEADGAGAVALELELGADLAGDGELARQRYLQADEACGIALIAGLPARPHPFQARVDG